MSMTIASQDPLYALYVANFDHGAEVLGYEDWRSIAVAVGAQVEQQVMAIVA
jgi:hypothetical protein